MKKVVFLHIQKTAGNTLHQILYNNRKGYAAVDYKNGKRLTPALLQRFQKLYPAPITGVGGHHIDCTGRRSFFAEEQFTFTFVREPLARYISFYNHLTIKQGYKVTIDEFLAGESQYQFQTQVIGHTMRAEDAIRVLDSNFDLVGVVEQMEKSLALLSHALNLDVEQKSLNQTGEAGMKVSDLTATQLEQAKANNVEDYKVYDYALKRLHTLTHTQPNAPKVSNTRKKAGVLLKKLSLWWASVIFRCI
jgi:hypothetical protein